MFIGVTIRLLISRAYFMSENFYEGRSPALNISVCRRSRKSPRPISDGGDKLRLLRQSPSRQIRAAAQSLASLFLGLCSNYSVGSEPASSRSHNHGPYPNQRHNALCFVTSRAFRPPTGEIKAVDKDPETKNFALTYLPVPLPSLGARARGSPSRRFRARPRGLRLLRR
jgi:hypothetical protein